MSQLSPNFINELVLSCLGNKRVLEACVEHLKFEYLPDINYKEVWNAIVLHYRDYKIPITHGLLSQKFNGDLDKLKIVNHIHDANTIDSNVVFDQLEEYIKKSMFIQSMQESASRFNKGSLTEAYSLTMTSINEINDFSLKASYFDRVLADYEKRFDSRQTHSLKKVTQRIPFCINELDDITHGGCPKGDTVAFMAQSGVGKSKVLKWIAMNNVASGFRGVHIQAEGTHLECMALYDALWTGKYVDTIERGGVTEEENSILMQANESLRMNKGELYVETFEKFNSKSMLDVREAIIQIIKAYGQIDFITLDYLEKVDPGDGRKYDSERERRIRVADVFKDICVEFDIAGFTATQASTVPPDALNDSNFVMTRFNISEVKALVNPFSFFFTLNQTNDEKDDNSMRIYADKIRKYRSGQVMKIAQAYQHEKFYDHGATVSKQFYQARS